MVVFHSFPIKHCDMIRSSRLAQAPLLSDETFAAWSCRISPPNAELRLHQAEVRMADGDVQPMAYLMGFNSYLLAISWDFSMIWYSICPTNGFVTMGGTKDKPRKCQLLVGKDNDQPSTFWFALNFLTRRDKLKIYGRKMKHIDVVQWYVALCIL